MSSEKIVDIACNEAVETWIQITQHCLVFNENSRLESLGDIGMSFLSFGIGAARIVPQRVRNLEKHVNLLEKFLIEFKKRVERCISISSNEKIIYIKLQELEIERNGKNTILPLGYKKKRVFGKLSEKGKNVQEDCYMISDVASHLVNCKTSDYYLNKDVHNSIKDIIERHKMISKRRRLLGSKEITPQLQLPEEKQIKYSIDDNQWYINAGKYSIEIYENRIKYIDEQFSKDIIDLDTYEGAKKSYMEQINYFKGDILIRKSRLNELKVHLLKLNSN